MFGILYMIAFSVPREDVLSHGYIIKVIGLRGLVRTSKH